ncbi:DNA/RNA non-specific endonuclease [Campylobacter sp. LR264d]|uniref:DNA/RNA non-specific endonuclease n=1 Tax=unclassified Campylobacter TaxID=2593542 RepID=UPI001238326F|nr:MULTISPECIES: DNA/RNA non-specific endonuclease [unclassified Campylobacter]KAA6224888.1 DNA/RNA non-specific endonuclease [Campylobacter sp. LR185c]KAA6233777.1 DNA/RNA non-specific endonuclease [Campylobacter sp. LR264d]KAA8604209.1 endonuclease [Campylobacter sp. LR185c]
MRKCFFILCLALNLAFCKYEMSDEFKPFFSKKNCSLIMDKYFYVNCYDYAFKGTKAIAYEILALNLYKEQLKKRPKFEDDTNIAKKYRSSWSDYKNSGYERGHIAPNASFSYSVYSQRSTFLMSNITPQNSNLNSGVWAKIEKRARQLAKKYKRVEVLNLIIYDKKPKFIKNKIAIPKAYVKVIKTPKFKECYQVSNKELKNQNINKYKKSCNALLNF